MPVIVYVSPSGGRAASAGTFITMAGHVAAMAPNTTIGAATPINSNGEDIEGALGRKVTNDAVAYIRGIAELRGRNADWAEQAVRDAVAVDQRRGRVAATSSTSSPTSMDDLLATVGRAPACRSRTTPAACRPSRCTRRASAPYENDTNLFETAAVPSSPTRTSPSCCSSLGGLALVIEIFHPTFVAGIFGVIALILAYFALGSLPTNWAGVALIVLGFALLTAEVFVAGFGALGHRRRRSRSSSAV